MALGESPPKHALRAGASGGSTMPSGDEAAGTGSSPPPPPNLTLRLWTEVANGIDKSQTVVWKNAVDSLEQAYRFLLTSEDARQFVESYMRPVISILLEQQPAKIGQMEKNCVEESLRFAVMIVAEDLKAKADASAGECAVLEVLAMVFNRKKTFYKGGKLYNMNMGLSGGLPEVRTHMITKFRSLRGFSALAAYLSASVSTPHFPPLEMLHQLLGATVEAIPTSSAPDQVAKARLMEDDAIRLARAVMDFMGNASEDSLKRQPHDILSTVRYDLQRIFDRLAPTRRRDTYAFYSFWRGLALKLITSQSLPLKLFGWDQVNDLIEASADMRPPPKSFVVSGAGCSFVNGSYEFASSKTDDGFARPGVEISYQRNIPATEKEKEGAGKTLTLFRCTMRSQQKWWFLSEADEEQPGTDKDIDYYQHKSKQHEEAEPPASGWVTCRNAGVDPPPNLQGKGVMVPYGEEYNTLEHQLAKWAIENGIIELVLGDSVHREVVARSTSLIKFLASMCERDEPIEVSEQAPSSQSSLVPNAYCLKASHLLLAWRTCTSKADAAVSAEVYQLLVSILPSLPKGLAIKLLAKIQKSLGDTTEKRDYLFEVAEFCNALASANLMDVDTGNHNSSAIIPLISDEVRAEVLKLLWAVLTHPDASSLKSYERLKSYVTNELRVEPMGTEHRKTFLGSCKQSLTANAQLSSGPQSSNDFVDEVLALRMVKLTKFILEACPRNQAVVLVTAENAALAVLLFRELTAYLNRRSASLSSQLLRKHSSTSAIDYDHPSALSERLHILRYAYGLSDRADMTSQQLDHLWALCAAPSDRELLMVFMANASNSEVVSNVRTPGGVALVDEASMQTQPNQTSSASHGKQPLMAAYSEDVRVYAFQNLFCATSVNWEQLGEGAYQSFQMLFRSLRQSTKTSLTSSGPALDALWRICLAAGNDDVATQAMKDLLAVYSAIATMQRQGNTPNAWTHEQPGTDAIDSKPDPEESFAQRVFECLVKVQQGLEAGDVSSERSAERCLRILNAAVGHTNGSGRSGAATHVAALASISTAANVGDALRSVPHGMRGQACYRTIGIMAKRTSPHAALAPIRDEGGNMRAPSARLPSSVRFSLDVHPLETLSSIKAKVANYCNHPLALVKPISASGRQTGGSVRSSGGDASQVSLSVLPDDSLVAHTGIVDGCEVIFLLADRQLPASSGSAAGKASSSKKRPSLDLSEMFSSAGPHGSADRFFDTLLAVIEALPVRSDSGGLELDKQTVDTHKLVWDLLLAMPTNVGIVSRVRSAACRSSAGRTLEGDAMVLDDPREEWSSLLNGSCFHRSVYVMQVVDSFILPAPEILSSMPEEKQVTLTREMQVDAVSFRRGFIDSGGFESLLRLFIDTGRGQNLRRRKTRMGNAFALRILKCCFFGNAAMGTNGAGQITTPPALDDAGKAMLASVSNPKSLLQSLTSVVVDDSGVSYSAIMDVLQLLQLLFVSNARMTEIFASLPNSMAERFLVTLLLWENVGALTVATVNAASRIRKSTQDLILIIPSLSHFALSWLTKALDEVDVGSDVTNEFFAVLRKLVEGEGMGQTPEGSVSTASAVQMRDLATAVCNKLASHPRPTSDSTLVDFPTGVLCGCLKLLRALIENGGGAILGQGIDVLVKSNNIPSWSNANNHRSNKGVLGMLSSPFRSKGGGLKADDAALIDLMGAIFDGFLSTGGSSSSATCCDKDSRQMGFDVVAAAARSCEGGDGYLALVSRISGIIGEVAPSLRHRWGQRAFSDEGSSRPMNSTSKYSGLRNQGCTCYMNSFLQQLFMMPKLRKNLCSAPLPTCLRTSGGGAVMKGAELAGKKISLQWDNGISYDAFVEGYDDDTGMHTIRYCPLQIATVGGPHGNVGNVHHQQQQIHPDDVASLPQEMPDEFFLSEGRPGKETGVFEVVSGGHADDIDEEGRIGAAGESSREGHAVEAKSSCGIEETEDEASSRHLLEEVQRTFVHLDEGARGRCFDPRSLVEASGCLKLEFDVWQQNDASEYAMKLLDRLEISLKRWAPSHFKFLDHTFGLKRSVLKTCKECGLKSNREEHLMTIDCQIRGKSDIHEALSTMCEVEFLVGDNKVFCDRCKKNRDTVLRTAISALPDMLVLSLKRFDLDYATFETVKLNSRCAFGQTLNMKRYTVEGLEAMEKSNIEESSVEADSMMDTGEDASDVQMDDPLSSLPDEDYEYKLAGVLVHAGVAQGGHYYSFIKDRSSPKGTGNEKWYRFDDEDVTAFDPSSIEVECFGGKVKKEKNLGNGHFHTSESEQFANALMLFYEKVKPAKFEEGGSDKDENKDCPMDEQPEEAKQPIEVTSGYDVFQPDVRRSNTTHSWQTFLFDAEFQSFLKGLLGLCLISVAGNGHTSMELSTPASSPSLPSPAAEDEGRSWRLAVMQMLLSFVFNILLHSAEKGALNDWTMKLLNALESDKESARSFVHDLARRTQKVSSNWLRVYCADCPEEGSRLAALRIFSAAMHSCASFSEEQHALRGWVQAWRSQIEDRETVLAGKRQHLSAMPTKLEGSFRSCEDLENLGSGSASSIGIILSELASLIEVAPRTWRYNSDLCVLVREISSMPVEFGGNIVRAAMIANQIPARLICLAIREGSPPLLRSAFPGASVAFDIAEALVKTETTPTSHLLPMSGSANAAGTANAGGANAPIPSDHLNLLEAITCIMGIQGTKRAVLVSESGESSKGRPLIVLSKAAEEALGIVFHESKSTSADGMGQNDIRKYMRRCGVDASSVPPQKILNILNKYPTTSGGNGAKEGRYLSLEGFLAYYRDTAQINDAQVRSDLHIFGFRPDLTRHSEESRRFVAGAQGDRQQFYQPVESVALDVAFALKEKERANLGRLAEIGLLSFQLYSLAYSASEPLAEYMLAAAAFGRDTSRLLADALKALNRAPSGWAGSETVRASFMVFRVLAALPDDKQQERITALMQSTEKAHSHSEAGIGLLVAGKELSMSRSSPHYSADYHYSGALERYIDAIKELYKQREVFRWMSDHRSLWGWIDGVRTDIGVATQQSRGDFTVRRDVGSGAAPLNHHHHSDSDMNAGINDSEDDDDIDDDSRYDQVDTYGIRGGRVIVEGAGVTSVNGTYTRNGSFDHVGKYIKVGMWKEREVVFSLFRCPLSDNTKRWYISIVPKNIQPGTNKDVDFYSAPVVDDCADYPPAHKWATAKEEGADPAPVITWKPDPEPDDDDAVDGSDGGGRMWNSNGEDVIDDDGDESGQMGYM